ncbi:MAG TPA: hypothetical protein ENF42_03025, partial [Candidatus Bathyarchaeota archaeon]|nr:hypothetical protein [Candidatus Bathyarchaeota archaeon]
MVERYCNVGISQVAVTAIMIVLGISASLLLFGPLRGFIIATFRRTTTVGGGTQLQIIAYSKTGNDISGIVVKNIGPNELPYDDASAWQVVVDGELISVSSTNPSSGPLPVDGTIILTLSSTVSGSQPHSFEVYGPQGTVAQNTFTPLRVTTMKIRSKTPATLNMGTTGLLIVTSIIISSSILLIAIWMIQPPICDRLELTQTAIQTYSLLREIALNLRSQPPRYIDREQCILVLSETLQLINQSLKDRGMHLTVDSILVTQDLQTTVEYTVWQGENYVTTTLTTGKGGYSVDLQPDTLQVDIPTRPFTVNLTFTVINTGIRVESVRLTGDNVQAAYYQGQDPRVQVQGASILIENLQPGEAILGLILEFHVPQGLTTSIAEAIVEESEFSDYTYISWTQGEQWLSLNEQLDLHAGPYPSISTVGSRQGWSNLIWDYQTWSGAWGGYVDPDGGSASDWYDNLNPDQGNHNVYPTHGGQLYYDPTTQRWYEITDDGTVYVPGGESGFPPSASGREVGRLVRVIWVPGYGLMEV